MTKIDKIQENLIEWFSLNKRNYPWRNNSNPYFILIAEIMLQRTKADQVIASYLSFIKEFPTCLELSKAPIERIQFHFKNLGLFWKSQKIKQMAIYLSENCGCKIPSERKELLDIPGIGDYIAEAILCFAYEQNVIVIDSNIARFISRVFGIQVKSEGRRDKKIKEKVNILLYEENPKIFNFALLDFTALICKPKNPDCKLCPINNYCNFFQKQMPY